MESFRREHSGDPLYDGKCMQCQNGDTENVFHVFAKCESNADIRLDWMQQLETLLVSCLEDPNSVGEIIRRVRGWTSNIPQDCSNDIRRTVSMGIAM